jgi:hypothetical protein
LPFTLLQWNNADYLQFGKKSKIKNGLNITWGLSLKAARPITRYHNKGNYPWKEALFIYLVASYTSHSEPRCFLAFFIPQEIIFCSSLSLFQLEFGYNCADENNSLQVWVMFEPARTFFSRNFEKLNFILENIEVQVEYQSKCHFLKLNCLIKCYSC